MKTTRRTFLAASAAAALGAAAARGQSANERLNIGIIGCGERGNALLNEVIALRESHNLGVTALCDVWKRNLESTAARVEKAGLPAPKTFSRFADLLALSEVDAVIIATPDFSHSPILVETARAKKHAYVEKPMASRIEDANAAVDAVVSNGIVCQVGTQFRSDGNYMGGARVVQSGVLGQLVKCHATYVRNEPSWRRSFDDVKPEDVDWEQFLMHLPSESFDPRRFRCWHLYRDFCNGLIGLLGVHVIDIAHWYAEDPIPVCAVGLGAKQVWTDREHDDLQECLFTYPKGHLMQFTGRLDNANGGPPNVFHGTRGTFDTKSWVATGEGGDQDRIVDPVKSEPLASPGHMTNWINCIRAGDQKTNADVHAGYAHSVASILGMLACDTGHRMRFDPETRTIIEG
jgi:predicted dehydrogenase